MFAGDVGRPSADEPVAVEGTETDPALASAEGGEPPGHRLGHAEHGRDDIPKLACVFLYEGLDSQRGFVLGGALTSRRNFTYVRPRR